MLLRCWLLLLHGSQPFEIFFHHSADLAGVGLLMLLLLLLRVMRLVVVGRVVGERSIGRTGKSAGAIAARATAVHNLESKSKQNGRLFSHAVLWIRRVIIRN